ncbi:MAG: site-2 protease family protein [Bacteroidia bacterium]|nr:site-2 protease family protein [Bacteroidia bacterium]
MKGSLNLGRIAGIRIEVHWTFILLLIWVVFLDIRRGGNTTSALLNIALILFLFVCVVLHELGHSLTARKFNISTKQITLLPIGGVASIEKMPENPKQELLVALAGPAVNVVLAFLLYLVVPIKTYLSLDPSNLENLLSAPSFQTLLFYLFVANVMLVVFNLIPAFPMDGGRVLRALLSFGMDRVKATDIAASIGQVFAVIFFVLGLLFNPFLVLIALFIFISAYGENKMVKQTSMIEGYHIENAMLTKITLLNPEDKIEEAIALTLAGTEKDFIVVDEERIVGILYQKDIISHVKYSSMRVKEIMKQKFKTISKKEELKKFFDLVNKEGQRFFPVIGREGALEGAIDMHNVSEFLLIRSQLLKS